MKNKIKSILDIVSSYENGLRKEHDSLESSIRHRIQNDGAWVTPDAELHEDYNEITEQLVLITNWKNAEKQKTVQCANCNNTEKLRTELKEKRQELKQLKNKIRNLMK